MIGGIWKALLSWCYVSKRCWWLLLWLSVDGRWWWWLWWVRKWKGLVKITVIVPSNTLTSVPCDHNIMLWLDVKMNNNQQFISTSHPFRFDVSEEGTSAPRDLRLSENPVTEFSNSISVRFIQFAFPDADVLLLCCTNWFRCIIILLYKQ